jgi:hypothetical protein
MTWCAFRPLEGPQLMKDESFRASLERRIAQKKKHAKNVLIPSKK